MKHPVRTIIINLVLVVVLVGMLIVAMQIEALNGALVVLGGIHIGTGNDAFLISDKSYEKRSNGSLSASEVKALDIAWIAGSVEIILTEGDTIRFYEESKSDLENDQIMRWKNENGKLIVRFGTKGSGNLFRNEPEKNLTIELPASDWEAENVLIQTVSAGLAIEKLVTSDFNYDSVSGNMQADALVCKIADLNSVSGNVNVDAIECEQLNADSVSGEIVVENAEVSDRMSLSTVSGDFSFTGAADEIEADTTSGNAELIFTSVGSSVEVDTTSGDVTVTLPSDVSGFTAEFDSASGELRNAFESAHRGDSIVFGDGSLEIEVDTTSGDLQIKKA